MSFNDDRHIGIRILNKAIQHLLDNVHITLNSLDEASLVDAMVIMRRASGIIEMELLTQNVRDNVVIKGQFPLFTKTFLA